MGVRELKLKARTRKKSRLIIGDKYFLASGKSLSRLACPMGRGTNNPPPLTGSRKLVKNKKLINFGVVVPKINKTFSV